MTDHDVSPVPCLAFTTTTAKTQIDSHVKVQHVNAFCVEFISQISAGLSTGICVSVT